MITDKQKPPRYARRPQSVKKVAERHFFELSHSVLAPMARPAPNAGKALLRKGFRGFAAHVAKSE
ncbi:MAG: hypothetical protein SO146_01160 [Eubacteriales bacterium]|nr:hypothetical protein [Eubacteriales bacterium]MDY4895843.1 hypothetical protein [Eubacteriales bacterium]